MKEPELDIVLNWWRSLENDKGSRAELRRARSATEVVFSPAYHRLFKELPQVDKEGLACAAGLCSHVKENTIEVSLAEQMAAGGDKSQVSGLRFRRLLAINSREELYHSMIRIIRLLNGMVNVRDLAKTVYWWNEKTKKHLAYDYYAKAKE